MSFTASALVLTWIALLFMGLVISGLVRQVHQLQQALRRSVGGQISGGAVGMTPPSVHGIDMAAVKLLIFLDDECQSCARLLTQLDSSLPPGGARSNIALVYRRSVSPYAETVGTQTAGNADELFRAVGVTAIPFAASISSQGRIEEARPIGSISQLRSMLTVIGLDRLTTADRSE